ncbi:MULTISPECIES: YihY/virulence factor BrkB family protein [Oceanobacillus]|uniref:YihY/virulence factor BrkB family protein n=1 Tax=Oceanobacillus aidingensis TaxID=645964 RepID=A0ABV9JTR0_9BACI|nr:YihY/virulence factor BrkB family protein [Oceanobacillus oncorhynchi]MDM8102174.1 YihY/virulence factor BrkB family protein [Oceanobacillus oncorhynchi]
MDIKQFGKDFMKRFTENNTTLLAAALAYYFLLAVFPLLIVGFAIIPYFNISPEDAVEFLGSILPQELAATFEENIISLVETPRGGLLTVGILGTIWSASNGINAFIKVSNQAFEVEETRSFIKARGIAILLTIGVLLAAISSIILLVFGDAIINFLISFIGISEGTGFILQISRLVMVIVIVTIILLGLYRFAPNKRLPFRHILPGTLTASILWLVSSFAFSIYVSNFGNYSATYGSLGGIIILMIWFFLTGIILLVGALLNSMYHQKKIDDATEAKKETASSKEV